MMKAEPVADSTRNTHNYFAQGGNELVIGGKLTFLPGATIEGGDDLFTPSVPFDQHRICARQRSDYHRCSEGRLQCPTGRHPQLQV